MDFTDHQAASFAATGSSLEDLARATLASCQTALLAARQTVLSSRDPVGIHGTRVALRRLRAALTLFDEILDENIARALRGDAKEFADICGPARDLDVFLTGAYVRIDSMFATEADISGELRALRAVGLRLRRSRHDAVRLALGGDVFAVFDVRLGGPLTRPRGASAVPVAATPDTTRPPAAPDMVAPEADAPDEVAPGWTDPVAFAGQALRRRDRKLRKMARRIDALDGAERHALRLRVKRQRYAAGFLAGLFDRDDASAYIRAATALQDALGLVNDRVVAAAVVADIRAAARPAGRLDWIAGVVQGVLAAQAKAFDGEDRVVAAAARRFAKAPRFWRRGGRDDGART